MIGCVYTSADVVFCQQSCRHIQKQYYCFIIIIKNSHCTLLIMPYYQTWEEFSRAAEKLYLTDPMKVKHFTCEVAQHAKDRVLVGQLGGQ